MLLLTSRKFSLMTSRGNSCSMVTNNDERGVVRPKSVRGAPRPRARRRAATATLDWRATCRPRRGIAARPRPAPRPQLGVPAPLFLPFFAKSKERSLGGGGGLDDGGLHVLLEVPRGSSRPGRCLSQRGVSRCFFRCKIGVWRCCVKFLLGFFSFWG